MFDDPIVNEIRTIRQRIAAEHDYDIHKLFAHWRESEKGHQERLIRGARKAAQLDSLGPETATDSSE